MSVLADPQFWLSSSPAWIFISVMLYVELYTRHLDKKYKKKGNKK